MIRFRVLGALDLRDPHDRELRPVLAQPKRLALLAYLAAARPAGFHRRDTLLGLFWPELDSAHARDALNQSLRFLREELGTEVVVSRGAADVGLDMTRFWCDASAFRELSARGQVEEALELYRGEFLTGFFVSDAAREFDHWLESERRHLRRRASTATLDLAEHAARRGDSIRVSALTRSMALELDSEAELRRGVTLLDNVGDRAAAVALYEDFARRLAKELDAKPAPETRSLVDDIRARLHPHPTTDLPGDSRDGPRAMIASTAANRRRSWLGRLIATGLLAGSAAALSVSSSGPATGGPPTTVVVVAPVNVLSADLELWREGLVDVLSRSLDGAGALRAVAPTAVMKATSGRNAANPEELARLTRAQLVLIGTLQPTGVDSVRFSVTVRDVARRVTRGEIDRRDAISRMDHLADTVAMEVLRLLYGETTRSAPHLRTVGTRSIAALKEFLQGQLFYRHRLWDSSETHFLRAIALDSTFALAYVGVAHSLSQRSSAQAVTDASFYSFRAAAFNHGLGARDSALIVLDSVYVAAYGTPSSLPRDPEYWPHIRRSMAAAQRLVDRYPEDAEVWVRYAEILYHLGGVATKTLDERVLAAFDHALALDPALGPAYSHTGSLGLLLRGWEGQRRYGIIAAKHGIGAAARDTLIVSYLERFALADPSRARRTIDTMSIDALWANYVTVGSTDVDGTLLPAATSRVRKAIRTGALSGVPESELNNLFVRTLLKLGRFREAAAVVDAESQPLAFAQAALVGALPDSRALPVFAKWLNQARPPFECLRLLEWWAQRGDSVSVERCRARRIREFLADSLIVVQRMARPAALLGDAFGALARRDTSRAVRVFDTFPDSLCPVWCWFAVDARARLLGAVGRQREGLELANYRSHVDFAFSAMTVPVALTRARLAAQLGDRSAIMAYRVVADTWAHADSALQPIVTEALAAMQRLDAQPAAKIGHR